MRKDGEEKVEEVLRRVEHKLVRFEDDEPDPLRISYSRLKTFFTCPFKHYLRYHMRMRFPSRDDRLAFGRAFHTVLEAFNTYIVFAEEDLEKTGRFFQSELLETVAGAAAEASVKYERFAEGVDVDSLYETLPQSVRSASDVTIDSIIARGGPVPRSVEDVERWIDFRPVELSDGRTVGLHGRIDMIGRDGEIVEYKTSSRRWSEGRLLYEWQPDFYAALLDQSLMQSFKVDYIVLVRRRTRKGETHEVQHLETFRNHEAARRVIELVRMVAPMLLEPELRYPVRDLHCEWCDARDYCDAYWGFETGRERENDEG